MVLCSKCEVKLRREFYENVPIHQCDSCTGHLLTGHRLKNIRQRREKQLEDFREELDAAGSDTLERIRCPKCRLSMEKRCKEFGPSKFHVDRCRKCDLYWLDGGELAKVQLIFEYSDIGVERESLKQRLANMSSAEKKELEDRIAKLPQRSFLEELVLSYSEGPGSRYERFFDILS